MHVDEYIASVSLHKETLIEESPSGGTTLLPVENLKNCFRPKHNNDTHLSYTTVWNYFNIVCVYLLAISFYCMYDKHLNKW